MGLNVKKYRVSLPILLFVLLALFFAHPNGIAEVESEDIRVGYSLGSFSTVNPKDAEIAIEIWFSQICRQSGMHFKKTKALLFKTLGELAQAVNNQKVDVVGLNSVDYLRIKDQVQLEPALVTVIGGDYGNKYVLLVHKESKVHKLGQLKAKKIFLHSGSTPIPHLWLRNLLIKEGLPREDRFFGYYKEVEKASQAILPVFFQQADACVVTRRAFETSAELNPQISQKLEPLIISPLFLDSVLLFQKNYKSDNKKIFIDTALDIKKYPMAKQVMTLFQIDGFALFSESYLANVIALMKESRKIE